MEDRECDKCIFHASGSCQTWECNFISVAEAAYAVEQLKVVQGILDRGRPAEKPVRRGKEK